MKNTLSGFFIFLAATAALFFLPAVARAETIRNFHTAVTVNPDATIRVAETINYDFGSASRHGIYRDIPTQKTNQEGKRFRMAITVVSVTDENGTPYAYSKTFTGPRETLSLKIGDASSYVSGLKTYVITYDVSGAITYFSDHDELLWNMTGVNKDVPVEAASYEVSLPATVPSSGVTQRCFTGAYGSTAAECRFAAGGGTYSGASSGALAAGDGLTAVVGFPPGYVAHLEPQPVINFFDTPMGKAVAVILVVLAIIWYILLPLSIPFVWLRWGRDPRGAEGPVSSWFDPPKDKAGRKLTPGETGLLVDETVDMRDIFATVIHLAQRGYLKIVEKKKGDFYFARNRDYVGDSSLADFERKLLSGIFTGTKKNLGLGDMVSAITSAISNEKQTPSGEVRLKTLDMGEDVNEATDMLYKGMTKAGFFPRNPKSVRTACYVLAGVVLCTGNIFLSIELFIFGRIMPRKTLFGVQQANIGKSLKNFLSSQERQLEFQAKNQMFFEKLLPYAIAFGVEKVWADRFKDIELKSPDWYQSQNGRAFTTAYFLGSMNSSFSTFRSAATPTSSSSGFSSGFSGGGFSGGGGGGGGVGSW